jgi:hypothetical protein
MNSIKTRIKKLEENHPASVDDAELEAMSPRDRYLLMISTPVPKRRTKPDTTTTPEEAYCRMVNPES